MEQGRRRTLRIATAASVLLPLAGCGGVLDPKGPIGSANLQILYGSLAIMLAIVVPTLIGAVVIAWWFRASNPKARYLPNFVFSGQIEMIVWSIPIMVIILLGGVIWIGAHQLDPYQPLASSAKPTEVQVVSLDWKWLFIYPEQGIASVNEAVVPAGKPVHFSLTSASVMNAFFVPQLGSMIYTMNGMQTQLYLQADKPGDYDGRSTMFSGDGFAGMNFTLRAVSDSDFANWVNSTKQNGPSLDRAGYETLERQSENVRPFTYREIDPALFHAIIMQLVPPGPGPSDGSAPAVRSTSEK
ncbi:MAG TPA: ubiquinol oxidase subunit II [Acetobacteraceae bacterium]|jgi:cytochrome o ubiquinol oxidase subunit 2|nr:ubiquinol oxidase subunit II [Acetobacteraceae bacterium]